MRFWIIQKRYEKDSIQLLIIRWIAKTGKGTWIIQGVKNLKK